MDHPGENDDDDDDEGQYVVADSTPLEPPPTDTLLREGVSDKPEGEWLG